MSDATKDIRPVISADAALLRMQVVILATLAIFAVMLFIGAGRIDWGLGWLFVAVWGLSKIGFNFFLRWHDPALLVERVTRHKNTQPYDRLVVPLYFLSAFATILVAGLDGGHFRWSGGVPTALLLAGYVLYLLGNGLASWAVASNPFFSSESRLQTERRHTVSRDGPYRYVRHPAYLASIILWLITGLLLDSWYAVFPGFLAALMMVIRTALEDRMLRRDLPGYEEYAQRTRFRLLPGVW